MKNTAQLLGNDLCNMPFGNLIAFPKTGMVTGLGQRCVSALAG
jgi:hypothetical protein